MTVDFNILAEHEGYHDFREWIVLNYYLPRLQPSVSTLAERLGVAESTLLEAMDKENLPRREKGWTNPRKGFYCERCKRLTPLSRMKYNEVSLGNGRLKRTYLCPVCKKGGEIRTVKD